MDLVASLLVALAVVVASFVDPALVASEFLEPASEFLVEALGFAPVKVAVALVVPAVCK